MTCQCPNTITISPRGWITATVDSEPTTRRAAIERILDGGDAYVNASGRWWRLDASTIGSPNVRNLPHHTVHECGRVPPPAATTRTRRSPLPERPPY